MKYQSVAYWVIIGPKELVMRGYWAMNRSILLTSTTDQLILIDLNPKTPVYNLFQHTPISAYHTLLLRPIGLTKDPGSSPGGDACFSH